MWAVCGKCGRWNLTPLEERWEAIEECEREYRVTIKRSSTEEIGLGRVREGTDLIRIGTPLRPEFAAWRYGRFFRRRRQVAQIGTAAGLAAMAGLWFFSGALIGVAGPTAAVLVRILNRKSELGRARRFIGRRAQEGFGKRIWNEDSVSVRIIPADDDQGWALRFALENKFLDFTGREAVHTAQLVAPALNARGADPRAVHLAVRDIEIAGSPECYFARMLKFGRTSGWRYTGLDEYPEEMRLAFEMAAHEESERSALEGELAQLESDWREAEEIASIADNMFIPHAITEFIEKHRAQQT